LNFFPEIKTRFPLGALS